MARFPKPVAIVNSLLADEFSSNTLDISLNLTITGTTKIQICTALIKHQKFVNKTLIIALKTIYSSYS